MSNIPVLKPLNLMGLSESGLLMFVMNIFVGTRHHKYVGHTKDLIMPCPYYSLCDTKEPV